MTLVDPGEHREHWPRSATVGYLPLVLVATFAVVGAPLLLVVWLRSEAVFMSAWAGVIVGVAGSLAISSLGASVWKRTAHSRDVLFSDLMLWGWLHHWRSARRVAAAEALIDSRSGRSSAISGREISDERKTSLLTGLIGGLEGRDPYTHGHSRRVARLAADIARQMGLDRREVAKIRAAGAIHDVGKIHTPVEILHKPGALNPEEFAVVARHPSDGADMVGVLGDPELTAMVRHHHERLDGSGYPDGLTGAEIPRGARILAVADTFDAITSTRSYREAHSHEEALRILAGGAGTQHDPEAVRAFERCYAGRRHLALWAGLVNGLFRTTPAFGAGGGAGAGAAGSVGGAGAGAWIAAVTVAVGGVGLSVESSGPSATGLRTPLASAAVATPTLSATAAPTSPTSLSATSAPTPTRAVALASGRRASAAVKPATRNLAKAAFAAVPGPVRARKGAATRKRSPRRTPAAAGAAVPGTPAAPARSTAPAPVPAPAAPQPAPPAAQAPSPAVPASPKRGERRKVRPAPEPRREPTRHHARKHHHAPKPRPAPKPERTVHRHDRPEHRSGGEGNAKEARRPKTDDESERRDKKHGGRHGKHGGDRQRHGGDRHRGRG